MTDKLNEMLTDCLIHHHGIAVVRVEEFGPAAPTMSVGPYLGIPVSAFEQVRRLELAGAPRIPPSLRVIKGGAS